MNTPVDLLILLGAQIKKEGARYYLAPHTQQRVLACANVWHGRLCRRVLVCGGHNFFVRYDYQRILGSPDFSRQARARALKEPSEAKVIRYFLVQKGIPKKCVFTENRSCFTRENASLAKRVIESWIFFRIKTVGILSSRKHLKRALPIFSQAMPQFSILPFAAEYFL